MKFFYLLILGLIVTFSFDITAANAQENDPTSPLESGDLTIVVQMNGPSTFYLDEPNQIIRATVDIVNYSPSDGQYFMELTHLPTNKVLKDFEINPRESGNELWSVQIAYPILESDLKAGNQTFVGDFEINIRNENTLQTASTKFLILETFVESEPIPEPVVVETPEPVVENQGIDSSDEDFSVQINEGFVKELTSIWHYLVIVSVGIIVGIIIIIKNSNRNDDEFSEDDEYDDDSIIETSTLTPQFQDMQAEKQSDSIDDLQLNQIIEDKILRISKLQENKIGNYNKLENIKKSLINEGSFSQADNDYIEEKYEEYKNSNKKK